MRDKPRPVGTRAHCRPGAAAYGPVNPAWMRSRSYYVYDLGGNLPRLPALQTGARPGGW